MFIADSWLLQQILYVVSSTRNYGQMNLYLNYFAEEENTEGDNPPIGIVLGAYQDEVLVKYATTGLANQLFVSKYQLYLPDEKALRHEVQRILEQE